MSSDGISSSNQDQNTYGFNWSPFNSSYSPPNYYKRIYDSFAFQTEQELNNPSYLDYKGKYQSYPGNGYVFMLDGSSSIGNVDDIQRNLSLLKSIEWIDRQTRAVLVEFSTYNANLNLFLVNLIVVEFLSDGSLVVSSHFDPINLFNTLTLPKVFILIDVIYMLIIVYFMAKSAKILIR
jgi:hypothetical protein